MQENIKELLEKLKTAFEQVQESNLYQNLEEKYMSLNPKGQKMVHIGGVALAVLLISLPTYSFFASSRRQQEAFARDRELLRELMQVASTPRSPLATSLSLAQAQQQALQVAQSAGLLPEQILPAASQPANSVEKLSQLKQQVFELPFQQLTLTQLVSLGQAFDKLPALKLTGLNVQVSSEDPHYYDVRFQLVHFEWPQPAAASTLPPKGAPTKAKPAAPKGSG